jgi:beta-xylosidase
MTDHTHNFEIGTALNAMTNFAELTTPVHYPKTAFHPYAGMVDLENNSQRGVGLPSVALQWATITQAERDQLKVFCPGNSAVMYIRTRTNDNDAEFKYYQAQMIWPSLDEEYDARTRQGFSILFRQMLVQAPPA